MARDDIDSKGQFIDIVLISGLANHFCLYCQICIAPNFIQRSFLWWGRRAGEKDQWLRALTAVFS